ncbi:hypothetical protein GWI33_001813 [Rhynchophorus ferrugineus]|uniref:Uncharacterized protein n=1 Tax=Rhynchophorus ferrugineus TaxID=354439 RepID=A0A834MG56_RHYFE|nr:hypothetical protein GWI33_001813 [Rhynchophorus ferrugineus]
MVSKKESDDHLHYAAHDVISTLRHRIGLIANCLKDYPEDPAVMYSLDNGQEFVIRRDHRQTANPFGPGSHLTTTLRDRLSNHVGPPMNNKQ